MQMYNIKIIMSHHLSNFHHLINSTCRMQPNVDLFCILYVMKFLCSVLMLSQNLSLLACLQCSFLAPDYVSGLTTVPSCCTRHVSTNSNWLNRLTFMETSLFLQWMLWQIVRIYHP